MARLLVSVRSAEEARLALTGGASIIDVKEPANGPLGRSSFETWRAIRDALPPGVKSSAALGELTEWLGEDRPAVPPSALAGFSYVKVGMAGVGPNWAEEWAQLSGLLNARRVGWIAVVYTDWKAAGSPSPTTMLNADFNYVGVLFDTWDKSKPAAWTPELLDAAEGFRGRGSMLAVAGSLTVDRLDEIAPFRPDIVAVRGAACEGGVRNREIDSRRVAELVSLVRKLPKPG